jgi:alanine racemase
MNTLTVAEINLNHLIFNLRAIRRKSGASQVLAVIKADAYGHGAAAVGQCLAKEGVSLFAVAQLKEAFELRESGITQPILVFGRLFPDEIPAAVKADFVITLFGTEDLDWVEAANLNRPARAHVNIDTGMGRTGILFGQEADLFERLSCSKKCIWEGLYSHFATSDEKDKTFAHEQLERFETTLSRLQEKGAKPFMIHMANSGAILDIPESVFDAVRPGILLYGHYPTNETSRSIKVKQVMTFKTRVAHARRMPAGHSISYGRRWKTEKETTIAVLAAGYADGVRRDLTNRGEVLIRGTRYPLVGTVTMDYIMADVGEDPIRAGDEAVLWGDTPQGSIQVLDVANAIGTIPYELTCGVSRRVQRIYIGNQ